MITRYGILDHGYVELVEHWGGDERTIEAARMSTNKGFQGWGRTVSAIPAGKDERVFLSEEEIEHWEKLGKPKSYEGIRDFIENPGDEKLLAYLYRNKHSTPFEMSGMTLIIQAPIFVFREWHRHRTQSYNEMSARYIPLPNVNYLPDTARLLRKSDKNKQAASVEGAGELTPEAAGLWLGALEQFYDDAQRLYEDGLVAGVPKELARLVIPVARYSRMMASANLRNWLGFLTLRMAPAAQEEIRLYANAVGNIVKDLFPRTWDLFMEKHNG